MKLLLDSHTLIWARGEDMHRTRTSSLPLKSIRCEGAFLVRERLGFDLDCRERQGQVHASGQASVRVLPAAS